MNISDVLLLEEQNGFRKGRPCTDDIFIIRQITEKRKEFNLETHINLLTMKRLSTEQTERHSGKLWREEATHDI
jgi:hypothetical protein